MINQKAAIDPPRTPAVGHAVATPAGPSRARHYVLWLSFVVAFLMFLDRACMGIATPMIMREFGVDKITLGWAASAFNWTYALFQIPGGWMADRFGSRLVLAVAITWWSIFTAATGAANSAFSLGAMRGLFGMGEAAAWPSASRALRRWLPIRNRAFGQGFQHAGSRFGAAVAPTMVVFLIASFSWRSVFYLFGAVGLLIALAWYAYYRDHPREHFGVNEAELKLLDAGTPPQTTGAKPAVPWGRIFRSRDLRYLSLMYFCYGWVLWLYLQWMPTYFAEVRKFTTIQMGLATSAPLLAATVTNIAGGWISDGLARKWGDLRRGRVVVSVVGFSIAGLAILPGVLTTDAVLSVACLTLALAGLELTVAVSWALGLDISGEFSGSVTGVMNTLGNLGGAASSVLIVYLATMFGWTTAFMVTSCLCGVAAVLATRIDPTRSAVAESSVGA